MKKNRSFIVVFIIIFIFIAVITTSYIDSGRVTTNHEPKCCIKVANRDRNKVTYIGLGYKVIRYVRTSIDEPYENNIGVKMGNWFMKYEFPKDKTIKIELLLEKKMVEITDFNDINFLENILLNSKYINGICNGEITYKIILDNEEFYIKEYCNEIQKDDKQASITNEDLEKIKDIISNNSN